jgi:hypothetical protein
MEKEFSYLDTFKPEDISVGKIWEILLALLFKGLVPSQVQHDEMRRAFYMGFTECFKVMNDLSNKLTEDQACDVLTRINKELMAFHDAEILRAKLPEGTA